jgi:hypothetical protein
MSEAAQAGLGMFILLSGSAIIERWNEVKMMTVATSITGAIGTVKDRPDHLNVPTQAHSPREFDA